MFKANEFSSILFFDKDEPRAVEIVFSIISRDFFVLLLTFAVCLFV